MPKFRITSPDGSKYVVNAPDGATEQDAIAYVRANAASIPKAETTPIKDISGALVQGVGQLVSLPGQIYGLATGDFDNAATRAGGSVEKYGTEMQSEAFRAQQEEAAARVADVEREDGFWAGLGQQGKELVSDPLAFTAGMAQILPGMVGTGGAALAGRAIASRLAAKEVAKIAARRGALAGSGLAAGSMAGGDAGENVYNKIMQTPQEVLERSDVYKDYIADGMAPDEARQATALRQARLAAAPAALVSGLTAGLGGIESALVSGSLKSGALRGLKTGIVKEAPQEGIEGASQGISENLAVGEIDPTVRPLDGVGAQVGAGLILGGAAGGGGGFVGGALTRAPEVTISSTSNPDGTLSVSVNGAPPVEMTPEEYQGTVAGKPGARIALDGVEVGNETTVEPVEGEPNPVGDDTDDGITSPTVSDTGAPPAAAGPTLEMDGIRLTPTVVIDGDRAIVDWGDGRSVGEMSVSDWEQTVQTYGVPADVAAPAVDVAAPPVVDVAAPVVETPLVDVAVPPVDVAAPVVETPPPAPPVDVAATAPTLPIESAQPITQEQFTAAETPTRAMEDRLKGKTMVQVARDLSLNAELPTLRPIMGRVAGVLEAFEKVGIKLKIGVQTKKTVSPIAGGRALKAGRSGQMQGKSYEPSIGVTIAGTSLQSAGTSEAVISHELIHAATFAAIDYQGKLPANSRVSLAVTELKTLSRSIRRQMTKDGMFNTDKYRAYRGDPNEIIAWGLTDSEFQQWLKTIPAKSGNAFTEFVQYIGKLLGVAPKDQNALAKLIEITDVLIPENAQDMADVVQGARGWAGMGGITTDVHESRNDTDEPGLTVADETKGGGFNRRFADRLVRLKDTEAAGTLETQDRSPLTAARKVDSKVAARIEDFKRKYFDPIRKLMRDARISLNDADWFLYVRNAEARNTRIQERQTREFTAKNLPGMLEVAATEINSARGTSLAYDPKNEKQAAFNQAVEALANDKIKAAIAIEVEKSEAHDRRALDFPNEKSKPGKILTSGSGISTAEARATLADYVARPEYAVYDRIGKLFDSMHGERMELAVKAGLVSRELADYLRAAEPNYAPGKGHADKDGNDLTVSEADFDPLMGYGGSGFSISRKEGFVAGGRQANSLPFSPLSTAISDAQTSISRGERNTVGSLFMGFAANNKSDLWDIYSDKNPPRDRKGRVISIRANDPEYLTVKRAGETFYIHIKDPLLARALKALDVEQFRPFMNSAFVRWPAAITRVLARSFTSWLPEFFTVNFVRDFQSALLNLMSEADGVKLAGKFAKYSTDMKGGMRAIAAYEFDTKESKANPEVRALYEQFKLDGGSVGWFTRDNPLEIAQKSKREFQDLLDAEATFVPPKNAADFKAIAGRYFRNTTRVGRAITGRLEDASSVFENHIRFAAYRAALDMGLSREQASSLSRDVTVDFNKRGEAGQALNAFFMFFNTGIQGAERTLRALSNNPMKTGKLSATQAAVVGVMGVAGLLAMYNAAISGEDDDEESFYDKIPEHEKDRNLIIMNPVDRKSYAKIPLPYGYGFFPTMVTRITDAIRLKKDPTVVGLGLTNALLQNFSPIQFQGSTAWTSIAKTVTPTLGKPLVDLMLNENFMRSPIYNEPFDKTQSLASSPRFSTPEAYKEIAQFMNDVSGGEGRIKGGLDTSAEAIEYVVEFLLGGATGFIKSAAVIGDEPARSPFVRKFVGSPHKSRFVGSYYENSEKAHAASREMKAKETSEERNDFRQRHRVNLDPSVQSALTQSRSALRSLNKQRKAIGENRHLDGEEKIERLDRLNDAMNREYVKFNTAYNRAEKREG